MNTTRKLTLFHHTLSTALACAMLVSTPHIANAKSMAPAKPHSNHAQQQITASVMQGPRIQLAILLDTSSSMDGLIDQTRNQLWSVVNEFSSAKREGKTPSLEVALFEYGNNGNLEADGYVRKLNSFTRELDRVSEGLFSLQTNGGDEYCGMAIKTAVEHLQWSESNNDIKLIFIAGNEPFTQGPVDYRQAIQQAATQGIAVNTIFAGHFDTGVQSGWQSGATLAGGDYMSIDANQKIVHINAPQDREIAELNNQLNNTYIPYGKQGQESAARQVAEDQKSNSISGGLLAKRAKSKASSYYHNSKWDLVDAVEEGSVTQEEIANMDRQELPAPMQEMNAQQRVDYVAQQADTRKNIKQRITRLSEARDEYVTEKKKEQGEKSASMNDALSKAVRKQATQKGFKLGG